MSALLNNRNLFLTGCVLIDQSEPPEYKRLMKAYDESDLIRYRAFVQRHGLTMLRDRLIGFRK